MNPLFSFNGHGLAGAALLSLASLGATRAETFTLEEATIDQMQKAMDDGALSSVELTSMYLNRIAIYDRGGIRLNSMPVINPDAFEEAAQADHVRGAAPADPLAGIPFAAKDSFNVAGLPTSNGVTAFLDRVIAKSDAHVITQLKASGAVLLGRANMSTMASDYDGVSLSYGDTKNPYGLDRSPSGSSCGSAVSVAANLVAFSLGGDTGGSIRQPASYNGAVGLKPSQTLVPISGVFPLYPDLDVIGPITRTVKDSAEVLDVIAFDDPTDPWTPLRDLFTPLGEAPYAGGKYAARAPAGSLRGIRLGIPKAFVGKGTPELGWGPFDVDPEIVQQFEQVKAALQAQGATVVEVDLPAHSMWNSTAPVWVERQQALNDGAGYGPYTDADFRATLGFYWNEFAKTCGLTMGDLAPLVPENIAIGNEDVNQAAQLVAEGKAMPFGANGYYRLFFSALDEIRRKYVADFMAAEGLDAFVFPTHFKRPAGEDVSALDDYYINDYDLTTPGRFEINTLGLAAVTVPMDFYRDGMPSTVTFMAGKLFDERKLLGYAFAYEQATKRRRAPTLTPALPGETIEYSTAQPPPSRPELNPPALRVAAGAKVTGQGKKATLIIKGGAVDASGLRALTVYVNGRKIAAQMTKKWKATVKLSALRQFVKGSAKNVQVTVVAKDIYGNTSVTTKTVKLPKIV